MADPRLFQAPVPPTSALTVGANAAREFYEHLFQRGVSDAPVQDANALLGDLHVTEYLPEAHASLTVRLCLQLASVDPKRAHSC